VGGKRDKRVQVAEKGVLLAEAELAERSLRLATEIAVSSGAQVALLVVPVVMLLGLSFAHPLALSFRWTELVAMAVATAAAAAVVWNGQTSRREGVALVAVYALTVVGFLLYGGR